MIAQATAGLNAAIKTSAGFRDGRVIDLCLPWKRSFEVNFELERI